MKALVWHGPRDVRVERVRDPELLNPNDAIVFVTATTICGSDLHLYNGLMPMMKPGDIIGHEFIGIVEEVGPEVRKIRAGDRVAVPFNIACGTCESCLCEQWALCDNTNPNAAMVERLYGYSGSGLFGYSHLFGGYSGGQAEYVRVPFADVGCVPIPDDVEDDRALYLTDVLPTGYMAAENCDISSGDVVAVWGCGPVGQFAIRSAYLLGADRVIAIDRIPERLEMASQGGAEPVNLDEADVLEVLFELTGGRGPDACIDCVGMEAHGRAPDALMDKAKQSARMEIDRAQALRLAIQTCGKGGTLSVPGVYGGFIDKMPFGAIFEKGLQLRTGQTHTHRYMRPLLDRIRRGEIDPSFIITHRGTLDDAPSYFELMAKHEDRFVKSFLRPVPVTRGEVPGLEREAQELTHTRR